MTIAFAFKYNDEIWAAIDRRTWFENSYILQDKYTIHEASKSLILSSGTSLSATIMDNFIQNRISYIEANDEKINIPSFYYPFYSKDPIELAMQDADYNGLIINKQGIFLIDEKLGCFNVGDCWAIGLQHDAARALILSIYHSGPFWMCPEKRSGNQICKDIFSILSKIDYMIPSDLSEINVFCLQDEKWTKHD